MNPTSFIATAGGAGAALWPCPAAGLASARFCGKLSAPRRRARNAAGASSGGGLSRWPRDCEGHAPCRSRRRWSHLELLKYSDASVGEEPTATSPPANANGENTANNVSIENANGRTDAAQSEPAQSNTVTTIDERAIGILVLLTVPVAWGTYTPVVKYMYDRMQPSMPGFVFSAGYYLVAATTLVVLSRLQDAPKGRAAEEDLISAPDDGDEGDAAMTERGGWELGGYLFLGNGLQVVGLQTVPADRAAFLVQLTTIMVPLVSALSAGKLSAVPVQTWIACIVAFTGVIIMGADGGDQSLGAQSSDVFNMDQLSGLSMSQGDILIILAAIAYTMHVVRLGAYAPRTTPLKLAASKATTEAILSVALVSALAFIGTAHVPAPEFVSQTSGSVAEYLASTTSAIADGALLRPDGARGATGAALGAILWTGWVTCAYTIYAQSFGQRRVNPTDSNLIYTTQPLFSSLFAYVLLGETLGVYGVVGAALIGTALWLVSNDDDS